MNLIFLMGRLIPANSSRRTLRGPAPDGVSLVVQVIMGPKVGHLRTALYVRYHPAVDSHNIGSNHPTGKPLCSPLRTTDQTGLPFPGKLSLKNLAVVRLALLPPNPAATAQLMCLQSLCCSLCFFFNRRGASDIKHLAG